MYIILFSVTKLQKSKEISPNLKSYINRIFTPEKERVKSSGNLPNGEIKRKERLITKIMKYNYQEKLSASIFCRAKVCEL